MNNKRVVYSLRVANELIKRGYKLLDSAINIKYPKYKVFYFEDSAELDRAIEQIANSKN